MPMNQFLQNEVAKFRAWAPSREGTSGEWECDYSDWASLTQAAEETMRQAATSVIDDIDADNLLYTIARDNEIEDLRRQLIRYPELLRALAIRAVSYHDSAARWQIVVSVHEADLADAADLIRPYLSDADEYVRRRSLLAIASHSPAEAEAIATHDLKARFEYTRIAALHVLAVVRSPFLRSTLEHYLSDPNEYVRNCAKKLLSESTTA